MIERLVCLLEHLGLYRCGADRARGIYEEQNGTPRFNNDVAMFEAVQCA